MPTLIVEELPQATFDRLMRLAASRRTTVRDEIIAWMADKSVAPEEADDGRPAASKASEEAPYPTAEEVRRQIAEIDARRAAGWEALKEVIRQTVTDPEERERLLSDPIDLPPFECPRNYVGQVPFKEGGTYPIPRISLPDEDP